MLLNALTQIFENNFIMQAKSEQSIFGENYYRYIDIDNCFLFIWLDFLTYGVFTLLVLEERKNVTIFVVPVIHIVTDGQI